MENDFYNSPEWMKIRAEVFRRDGYKCVDCGSIDNLQAHHLSNFDYQHPDLGVLVTVCSYCHNRRTKEQKKMQNAAVEAIGELIDNEVYRMYLVGVRKKTSADMKNYIQLSFGRLANGMRECTAALFYDYHVVKVASACGYNLSGYRIDLSDADHFAKAYAYFNKAIGKPFDLRVRHCGDYWNVKYNEIYPVL